MSLDLQRESFFMVRLIVIPLVLIVMLSWTVFWMDRSSLGDRINVSFIGILTAVAYQIVVSELLPHIAYFTLMNGFLNLSFLVMCATVVVNLVVGSHDQRGQAKAGDRIDRRCRWIFPLVYFGLILVMVGVAFTLLLALSRPSRLRRSELEAKADRRAALVQGERNPILAAPRPVLEVERVVSGDRERLRRADAPRERELKPPKRSHASSEPRRYHRGRTARGRRRAVRTSGRRRKVDVAR